MPADLERQLARFAEALDREASSISFDDVVGRGPVAVDAELLDHRPPDQVSRRNGATAEPGMLIELAPLTTAWRRIGWRVALGVAAVTVLVVALAAIERAGDDHEPADVPPSTVPTTPEPRSSGGMWPQSTLDEVRAAQERADAGNPDSTWQVEPQLTLYEEMTIEELGQVELIDRFLREVLGWEAYLFNPHQSGAPDGRVDGALPDLQFLRCAPSRTNPRYPPGPEPEMGERCAPTLDDLRYETVSVDLVQPDRKGLDGIWVVDRWRLTAPFAQADPVALEAQFTERLGEFLEARIAGAGADGYVLLTDPSAPDGGIPLLYASSDGARYERYEIERVDRPRWPDGSMTFSVRLFANGGATVVEQEIRGAGNGALWLAASATTENGRPVDLSYTSSDGEMTVTAPSTWDVWWPPGGHELAPDVWFGMLWRDAPYSDDGAYTIGIVDPVAYDAWCAQNGGSPLLSAPADAAEIAQRLAADPDFETTAPVPARVGGFDALSLDVALAPGGEPCGVQMIEISRWVHSLDPGLRLRLFLVDLPEGMPVRTLAITVVSPEERFEEFIEETAPIIDSIEFNP